MGNGYIGLIFILSINVVVVIIYFAKRIMATENKYNDNGIYAKNHLQIIHQKTSMNEIKDAQEQINMRFYSSESIKKIQSFFTLEIDHLLSISEICVMGILSFLIKNDYMDKKKEEEYINITCNFKYDKIKNKIISNPEITITDFIHCYRDYIIINALGRDKEHIFSSIEKIEYELDFLSDFIGKHQENINYKKNLLYNIENEWVFSGYIDHIDKLFNTIDKRKNIVCTHLDDMRRLFGDFNGRDLAYENYASLLGMLIKGYLNHIESISIEEINFIIEKCGCGENEEKFSKFYEKINNSKYTYKDFVIYFLEEVFSHHGHWDGTSINILIRRYDILYKLLNIHNDSSLQKNKLKNQILTEIDTIYELNNYIGLIDKIYNNYFKLIDINYIHNNKTSIQLNMPINDYMKIGLNPFVFNPLLTQMLIKAIEEYNVNMLKKRTLPNDLIKLTQAELLQIQEAYRHIRGINGISS